MNRRCCHQNRLGGRGTANRGTDNEAIRNMDASPAALTSPHMRLGTRETEDNHDLGVREHRRFPWPVRRQDRSPRGGAEPGGEEAPQGLAPE